jgi:hypothetical protein
MTALFNPTLPDLNDLNTLSKSRDQVSDKKIKSSHATAESTVEAGCGHKLDESRDLKASIDTGSSGCVILNGLTIGINHKRSEDPQQWMTKGGIFQTIGICPVKFYLPDFSAQECVKWNFHADNSKHIAKNCYDVILGRDLLEQLPSDIKFSDRTMSWQEATIPMKKADELDDQNVNETVEQCCETGHLHEVTQRTMEILDASCKMSDLRDVTSKCACLPKEERAALLKLLLHHEDSFDGALGTWNGPPAAALKLKKDAMPHFARPFSAPHVHDAQKHCAIVTQWGCLSHLHVPMGVSSSADVFQERMTELMRGLDFVCCCTDDVSTVSKNSFLDHLFKLDKVLRRARQAGLKINAKKSFFALAVQIHEQRPIPRLRDG